MAIGFTDPNATEMAPQGLQALDNIYSLDGDDLINQFYGTAENINLQNALISNGLIRPAGTLVMLNGENLRIVNTTLDGHSSEDPSLMLGASSGNSLARFNNINLINSNNGQVDIQNAIVDGLTVGGNATVTLRGGQLNNFRVTEDSNVMLRTEGGTLNRVHFNGADFDERSSFANAVIRGGDITDCNFNGVDFRGADISDVHMAGGEISGNFAGAMFRNMSIKTDIRDMEVSKSTTFHNVQVFDPTLNQYRRVDNIDQFQSIQRSYDMMDQVKNVGVTLAAAIQLDQKAAAEPAAERVEFTATDKLISNPAALVSASATEPAKTQAGGDTTTRITGGESLTLTEQQAKGAQPITNDDMMKAREAAIAHAESLDQGWIRG